MKQSCCCVGVGEGRAESVPLLGQTPEVGGKEGAGHWQGTGGGSMVSPASWGCPNCTEKQTPMCKGQRHLKAVTEDPGSQGKAIGEGEVAPAPLAPAPAHACIVVVAVWKLKRLSLGNQVRMGTSSGRAQRRSTN